ncbi:alpha/beta fold hydrolase [Streptomyces sp. NPDC048172]|uniref:alpha/beta fold hydrolase n=1 Tax=Streptomyces sp. NPDC048172 TaxID=3365505 RepID=UPI003713927B
MASEAPQAAPATQGPTYHQPGRELTDWRFSVPLDHDDPAGERIELYARAVTAAGRDTSALPWLLYLQGGPGGKAPRPVGKGDWLDRALQSYRVLLLDLRGTGLSTPVTRQTLPSRGDGAAQAAYLTHFRSDSIVGDCEAIRRTFLGEEGEAGKWSLLGQSYGGFVALSYLSFHPEGLREVMMSGGLPGLGVGMDEAWRAAYRRNIRGNEEYYARYPQDVATARRIGALLRKESVPLPDGSELTLEAFQSLGRLFGGSTGPETLHYLLEEALVDTGDGEPVLSDAFLSVAGEIISFKHMPLFPLLVEPSLDQSERTAWSAQRVRAEFPEFDAGAALDDPEAPLPFTGEMAYPWMFETDAALRPLREAAEAIHAHEPWPALYDRERLARNTVPTVAAVYFNDFFVDTEQGLSTVPHVPHLRTWVTSEYVHDGMRASGGAVLDRLIRMLREGIE